MICNAISKFYWNSTLLDNIVEIFGEELSFNILTPLQSLLENVK